MSTLAEKVTAQRNADRLLARMGVRIKHLVGPEELHQLLELRDAQRPDHAREITKTKAP